MTYKDRWNATARLLGYTKETKPGSYMAGRFYIYAPNGRYIVDGDSSIDFTHFLVVSNIEKNFPDIKWNKQPYLKIEETKNASKS